MPDTGKPLGQDVQRETPYKLGIGQPQYGLPATVAIVLGHKPYVPLFQAFYAMVAYRDLMGIAAQVLHYLRGPEEWAFAIHYPVVPEQAFVKRRGSLCSQLFAQPGHKTGPKDLAHSLYGEEVFSLVLGRFPFAGSGNTAPGNNAVQVWVQRKVLSPGVQDGDHSHPGAQEFGVGAKILDNTPGRFEQKFVNQFGPVQT